MAKDKPGWLSGVFRFGRGKQPAARPAAPQLDNDGALASGQPVIAGDWHPGQTLLDDFLVEGLLGERGMGILGDRVARGP